MQIHDWNVFAEIFSLLYSIVRALENRGQETKKNVIVCAFFLVCDGRFSAYVRRWAKQKKCVSGENAYGISDIACSSFCFYALSE